MAQGLNYPALAQRRGTAGQECAVARAYAMGLISIQDCELGQFLQHSGGYPGYGSFMMFMPERGVGIFGFSNRTYTSPAQQVMAAAGQLAAAGAMPPRTVPVSEALARTYRAAGQVYVAGNLDPARQMLAMNFLLDRSPENWARTLAELRQQVGTCRTETAIVPTGALAGNFDWQCERGRLQGQVLLAPTSPPTIQALRFRPVPNLPATR
jgi:hypothetical protein